MYKLLIFTSIFLIWRIIAEDVKNRRKRIANGFELRDRDSGFAVSRYSIWMSHVAFCSSIFNTWSDDALTVICDVDYKKLRCGGALLTPTIVQTACHCVADTTPYREGRPSRYVLINPDEQRFYIFAGWNVVSEMRLGYGGNQYVLNERCANYNMKNATHDNPYPLLFDYGLVILKSRVQPYAGFESKTNYAPIYTVNDLESMWRRVLSKELTCLFAGYGDGKSGSRELRHGWAAAQSYLNCKKMMDLPDKTENFNYQDDATFGCFLFPPNHKARVINGDSGSPVTCDNEYVGVTSFGLGLTIDDQEDVRTVLVAPLVFSLFENAMEHRRSLSQLNKNIKTIKSLPRPVVTRQTIVINDFAMEDQSPRDLNLSCSCLIQSVDFMLYAIVTIVFFINKINY